MVNGTGDIVAGREKGRTDASLSSTSCRYLWPQSRSHYRVVLYHYSCVFIFIFRDSGMFLMRGKSVEG